jgi:iron complex transport system ATP-binding protein
LGINVENLCFSYGEVQILRNISFSVNEPGIVGIIGPNGSGKTTLVKNISGLLKSDSGQVLITGKNVSKLALSEKARILSYVPQSQTPNFSHSVFYTVLMGRKPYIGWSYSDNDKGITENILNELDLDSLRNRMFSTLSGGEKQKVILGRAIAQNCKLMILDEPTSNLDLHHQQEVLRHLRNLSDKNRVTVLMVIHDLNLASMYCDRLILLDKGKKVIEGVPSQVITKELIKSVYSVDVDIIKNRDKTHILLHQKD